MYIINYSAYACIETVEENAIKKNFTNRIS